MNAVIEAKRKISVVEIRECGQMWAECWEPGMPAPKISQVRAHRVRLHPSEINHRELELAETMFAESKAQYKHILEKGEAALPAFIQYMDQPHQLYIGQAMSMCYNMLRYDKGRVKALKEALVGVYRTPDLFEEPFVPTTLEELRLIAQSLVEGCLANLDAREHRDNPNWGMIWTEEKVRRNPTVRIEYEYTTVISCIGEGMAIGRGKNWGPVIGVFPLRPDDPVHPTRMLFVYKDKNPYNRRFEQREAMRAALTGRYKQLVSRAMHETKAWFVTKLKGHEADAIADALRLRPEEFWRAAKGKPTGRIPRQARLFVDDTAGEGSELESIA